VDAKSEEVNALLASFRSWPREFSLEQAASFLLNSEADSLLREKLESDEEVMRVGVFSCGDTYIPKRALARSFASLNARLALAQKFAVFRHSMTLLLSDTFPVSWRFWKGLPDSVFEFGEHLGLIRRSASPAIYCFPLAMVVEHMTTAKGKGKAKTIRFEPSSEMIEVICEHESQTMAWESTLNALGTLTNLLSERQRAVVCLRNGLQSGGRLTLEKVAQRFNVTRERIRQIELKAINMLKHSSKSALRRRACVLLAIADKGSVVAQAGTERSRIAKFLYDLCGVPTITLEHLSLMVVGFRAKELRLPNIEDLKEAILAGDNLVGLASAVFGEALPEEDALTIAALLRDYAHRRMTKFERAVFALRRIGRPAHFSEIARAYNRLFPNKWSTEHNVHAVLGRDENRVVWTGIKGVYALREWGYEKPSMDLFETVAKIVRDKFHETGKPVPFLVIQVEIGKYRKLINPHSLTIAAHVNKHLKRIGSDTFVPKSAAAQFVDEDSSEELDEVLRGFEDGEW